MNAAPAATRRMRSAVDVLTDWGAGRRRLLIVIGGLVGNGSLGVPRSGVARVGRVVVAGAVAMPAGGPCVGEHSSFAPEIARKQNPALHGSHESLHGSEDSARPPALDVGNHGVDGDARRDVPESWDSGGFHRAVDARVLHRVADRGSNGIRGSSLGAPRDGADRLDPGSRAARRLASGLPLPDSPAAAGDPNHGQRNRFQTKEDRRESASDPWESEEAPEAARPLSW